MLKPYLLMRSQLVDIYLFRTIPSMYIYQAKQIWSAAAAVIYACTGVEVDGKQCPDMCLLCRWCNIISLKLRYYLAPQQWYCQCHYAGTALLCSPALTTLGLLQGHLGGGGRGGLHFLYSEANVEMQVSSPSEGPVNRERKRGMTRLRSCTNYFK